MFMLRKRIPAFLLVGILVFTVFGGLESEKPDVDSSVPETTLPEESVPMETEKPWEPSEYVLCWNLDGVSKLDPESGMTMRKAEGGLTSFRYLSKDGVRTLYTKNRKIVPKLDQIPLILLRTGEDGEILGYKDLTEEGYRYTCCSWYAESIDKNSGILSLRSDAKGEAMQYLLDPSECPVLSADETAAPVGEPVPVISAGDRITIAEDPTGKPAIAFMTFHQEGRRSCLGAGKFYGTDQKIPEVLRIQRHEDTPGVFRAGFSRVDITPRESVPLAGYGNTSKRMSTGYQTYVTLSCIAVTDEEESTVLLYSIDTIGCLESYISTAKRLVSNATGVPEEYIQFTATHTHASTDSTNNMPVVSRWYSTVVYDAAVRAAEEALLNRCKAVMKTADVEIPLNYIRHYYTADGIYVSDNHNSDVPASLLVDHTVPIDHTMHILVFDREDDKDIYYTNWRAHVTRSTAMTTYEVSADYVDAFRLAVEKELDCYCAYYQGAAGNVNPKSRLQEEQEVFTGNYLAYGQEIAKYVVSAATSLTDRGTGRIRCSKEVFPGEVDHTRDSLRQKALYVRDLFNRTGDREKANEAGIPLGIFSVYEASAIISRADKPATQELELAAVTIGNIGFAYGCYEMFNETGEYIEAQSPCEYTLVHGYSNRSVGYMPSEKAIEYGCYEADTTSFVKGTAEICADKLLALLKGNLDR